MERLPIKVVCLESSAGLALPAYQTSGSSGMDVLAAVANDLPLRPGAVELIQRASLSRFLRAGKSRCARVPGSLSGTE